MSSVDTDPGQETNDETHGTRVGSMCQLGKRMGNLVGSQDGWSSTPALPFKWEPSVVAEILDPVRASQGLRGDCNAWSRSRSRPSLVAGKGEQNT